MTQILTVTLNPALDVTTSVEELKPREKLRCADPRFDPGGGGVNVSRAIRELGGESRAFVAVGGATGEKLLALLEQEGVATEHRELKGDTRISLKVFEQASAEQYRFVLPGPEQAAERAEALMGSVIDCAKAGGHSLVVASGSLPTGFPEDFHARLSTRLRESGVKFVLDTSGPWLKGALPGRPWLIKPDQREAAALLDMEKPSAGSMQTIAERLWREGAAEVVVVTLGADGAIVVAEDAKLRIRPPEVDVLSTVGAGDSFVGALVLGLARGWPLEEAARYGVAAAASAVGTEATALCQRTSTQAYFEAIAENVERL